MKEQGIVQPVENVVSYEEMMEKVSKQAEQALANPDIFNQLVADLKHGHTSVQVKELEREQAVEFDIWSEKLIAPLATERLENPNTASQVEYLTDADLARIKKKAEMHYLVERDLVGPLIVHFAHSIKGWQQGGMLPDLTVGMFRDFQPFYVASTELGANIAPWYLRRALFSIGDELDTDDIVKDATDHSKKLALWLKPLLTADHVNLLDSGCWGTVVYEIAGLRSVVNWLANSGKAEQLEKMPASLRSDKLYAMLPPELVEFLNTGFSPAEVKTRWEVVSAIVNNDEYLKAVKGLFGQQITTTALDHYSHPWRDPRVPNHQMIYSHIDVVAGVAMPSAIFGELINDTIEENHASKIYKGPTQLQMKKAGSVEVVLEKNNSFEEEVAAWASCKGVQHAVQIALKKMSLGIDIDPKETVAHMSYLANRGNTQEIFTGVLPHNTPTWSKGHHFIANIWPKLANNPYSTYKPFNHVKGV